MNYETAHAIEPELRDGPPRRVRYTASALLLRRSVWGGTLALCLLLASLASREWRRLRALGTADAAYLAERGASWASVSIFWLLIAAGVLTATERGLRGRRALLARGVAVMGMIDDRHVVERRNTSTHHTTHAYRLRYTYRYPDPDGDGERTGVGEVAVSEAQYHAHPKGTPLTVLYRPDEPWRGVPYRHLGWVELEGAPTRRV